MKARHLVIAGRVQGVGFRDWMAHEARVLGIAGWVRNVGANVEALLYGEEDAVKGLVRACRRGPRAVHVASIEETLRDLPDTSYGEAPVFVTLPSV